MPPPSVFNVCNQVDALLRPTARPVAWTFGLRPQPACSQSSSSPTPESELNTIRPGRTPFFDLRSEQGSFQLDLVLPGTWLQHHGFGSIRSTDHRLSFPVNLFANPKTPTLSPRPGLFLPIHTPSDLVDNAFRGPTGPSRAARRKLDKQISDIARWINYAYLEIGSYPKLPTGLDMVCFELCNRVSKGYGDHQSDPIPHAVSYAVEEVMTSGDSTMFSSTGATYQVIARVSLFGALALTERLDVILSDISASQAVSALAILNNTPEKSPPPQLIQFGRIIDSSRYSRHSLWIGEGLCDHLANDHVHECTNCQSTVECSNIAAGRAAHCACCMGSDGIMSEADLACLTFSYFPIAGAKKWPGSTYPKGSSFDILWKNCSALLEGLDRGMPSGSAVLVPNPDKLRWAMIRYAKDDGDVEESILGMGSLKVLQETHPDDDYFLPTIASTRRFVIESDQIWLYHQDVVLPTCAGVARLLATHSLATVVLNQKVERIYSRLQEGEEETPALTTMIRDIESKIDRCHELENQIPQALDRVTDVSTIVAALDALDEMARAEGFPTAEEKCEQMDQMDID